MIAILLVALASVASAQNTDEKVRVFVGESTTWESSGFNIASASGSANWRSAQSSAGAFGISHAGIVKLTVAVMKQLDDHCPTVVVVDRPDNADYFVRLDQNTTMWTRHDDMAVFNRAGEMVFVSSAHSVSKGVKRFCQSSVFTSGVAIQRPQTTDLAQKETTVRAAPVVNVAPQPIVAPVSLPTIPASGLVLITFASNPPGALVSFSGMGICYAPCFTKLQPQRYKVKMTLPRYADWTGELAVEAGKPATVVADLQR